MSFDTYFYEDGVNNSSKIENYKKKQRETEKFRFF